MKVLIPITLLIGPLGPQSKLFSGASTAVRLGFGVLCLFGLVVWFVFMKRRKGVDPVLMLNDAGED